MTDPKAAARARQLLEQSVEQLNALRNANTRDAGFKEWRQSTLTLLQRFWPGSDTRSGHFRRIPFSPPSAAMSDPKQIRECYERGVAEAAHLLEALIEELGGPKAVVHDSDPGADVVAAEAETSPEPSISQEMSRDTLSASAIEAVSAPESTPAPLSSAPTPPVSEAKPASPVAIPRVPKSNAPARGAASESGELRRIEQSRRPLPPGVTPAAAVPPAPGITKTPSTTPTPVTRPGSITPIPGLIHSPISATGAKPTPPPEPAPKPTPVAPVRAQKPAKKNGQKQRLKDMLGFTDDIDLSMPPDAEPPRAKREAPAPPPLEHEPPRSTPSRAEEHALQEALEAALFPMDERNRALESDDLLGSSPVFKAKGRPLKKKGAAAPAPAHTPAALAVLAMATEVQTLGVPEGQRARARAALIDLASHLDHHDLTWNGLREAVGFVMEFPPIGRRVLPLLLPYLDEAA